MLFNSINTNLSLYKHTPHVEISGERKISAQEVSQTVCSTTYNEISTAVKYDSEIEEREIALEKDSNVVLLTFTKPNCKRNPARW